MNPAWHILYRGPLSSCNYACPYCPFAKTRNTAAELADDSAKLDRFVNWVEAQCPRQPVGVLFTPWGEALIHKSYQNALARLSHIPHVTRAAIQTNLSCALGWVEKCNLDRLALWTTFHPGETTLEKFLAKCREARSRGVRFSVGVVGRREVFEEIKALREALTPEIYLWINAWKREPDYYSSQEMKWLLNIDPHFHWNAKPHPSLGKLCHAGHTAFTVNGDGEARRCHFLDTRVGNIYEPDFTERLYPKATACSANACRCHIGYVHMPELGLYEAFSGGVLERIPASLGSHENTVWEI